MSGHMHKVSHLHKTHPNHLHIKVFRTRFPYSLSSNLPLFADRALTYGSLFPPQNKIFEIKIVTFYLTSASLHLVILTKM